METIFPTDDWTYVAPEEVGVESARLRAALDYLRGECLADGLKQTLLVRHGRVFFAGDNTLRSHNIYSCTKSVTSTALGLLIAEGKCTLDTVACEVEPLLKEQYPEVTLRHFATMSSGYNAVGQSRWNEPSADWSHTPYVPGEPLFAPGSAFAYWDEAMFMFGRVLTRIAGCTLKEYVDEKLFKPMNIGHWSWWAEGEVNGREICVGGTGIDVHARQLARFALLFLNEGCWDGNQLVPSAWIREATGMQVPIGVPVADTDRRDMDGTGAYGYNWWLGGGPANATCAMPDSPSRTYYASGLMNNVCLVVPEWDFALVRMGKDGNPGKGKHVVYNEFLKRLHLH